MGDDDDVDDETPERPEKPIEIGELYSKDTPEFDPEFDKVINVLEEFKEHLDKAKSMSPEEQKAYMEDLLNRPPPYPSDPLSPCKNKDMTCRNITQAFGLFTNFGFGEIQELCDLTVFHEALDKMDLDECEEALQPEEQKLPAKVFLNRCLLMTMENIVRERLVSDGFSEEEAQETGVNFGLDWNDKRSRKHDTYSPFSAGWVGPLAEEAEKKFKEEE